MRGYLQEELHEPSQCAREGVLQVAGKHGHLFLSILELISAVYYLFLLKWGCVLLVLAT